eukprot:CAMPEP_0114530838 /NCGR_PEP_ID=MMETSP0109-20121206/25685_1 /TAXON_ID=29199 /ORGANISM="Chlorarachnion reptans, Strain CCCM449" /LENGTH=307 /DNA_ID=CAMNT_0001713541 /DNA_START=504 /DNA_END=1427 /DNA_ORIENTATION=+
MASAFKTLGIDCSEKNILNTVLVPTQRRYLRIFQEYLDGSATGKLSTPIVPLRLMIRKLTCHGIPFYHAKMSDPQSCRPYVQVFQESKLIQTSVGSKKKNEVTAEDLKVYDSKNQVMEFILNQNVKGDILIRMRHFQSIHKRITMFRCGFYTSFIGISMHEENSDRFGELKLRLPFKVDLEKSELDIASTSDKFSEDFKVEILFGEATEDDCDDRKQIDSKILDTNTTNEKMKIENEDQASKEEDIEALESRLHQVLDSIDTSDDEYSSTRHTSKKHNSTAVGDDFLGGDDDGEKLIAALRAELEED